MPAGPCTCSVAVRGGAPAAGAGGGAGAGGRAGAAESAAGGGGGAGQGDGPAAAQDGAACLVPPLPAAMLRPLRVAPGSLLCPQCRTEQQRAGLYVASEGRARATAR